MLFTSLPLATPPSLQRFALCPRPGRPGVHPHSQLPLSISYQPHTQRTLSTEIHQVQLLTIFTTNVLHTHLHSDFSLTLVLFLRLLTFHSLFTHLDIILPCFYTFKRFFYRLCSLTFFPSLFSLTHTPHNSPTTPPNTHHSLVPHSTHHPPPLHSTHSSLPLTFLIPHPTLLLTHSPFNSPFYP